MKTDYLARKVASLELRLRAVEKNFKPRKIDGELWVPTFSWMRKADYDAECELQSAAKEQE